ncbi:MAG: acetyl-CoA carboxylase, carboxyltransferase subunit beta [Myxococcota bacterium]
MSNGTRWFEQEPPKPQLQRRTKPAQPSENLWTRCPGCQTILYNEDLEANLLVCPKCGYHLRIGAMDRLMSLVDEGSFVEQDLELRPTDPLRFTDSKTYTKRLASSKKKTGRPDAYIAGEAHIDGRPVQIGSFDFRFMGGSMGSVVGEMVTRQFERAVRLRQPAIVISASGGARMQEGVFSLMQMAKTCAALARLRDEARMPYISILTHPTTGGVAASFSMLGDLIFAEPNALIGFAGPRVIEQTIGESLPEGFQTSEYLLAHGMIDRIVTRDEMRSVVARSLALLTDPA